ncbi:MAG: Fic family protein, partial [Phenylobacterium sp.]|nr:Fic family protein [Phenylobacterium sp.]
IVGLTPSDRNVDGVVEMLVDATTNFDKPLTKKRIFSWHTALFPTGRSGLERIQVGKWRDDRTGPMQVVSGSRLQRVHFEAPAAGRLDEEMKAFLRWFDAKPDIDAVIKAGIAHLWFVTIHPFQDGNGRIARAIADMGLARSEKSGQRFYSMSSQIRSEAKAYYETLEATQRGDCDVTAWLEWFLGCLDRAFDRAEGILGNVLHKAAFWEKFGDVKINDRQRIVLNRLLDGFEGKLTSSKYATLAKTSPDTALRDIDALIKAGMLVKQPGGGRSTSYALAETAGVAV